jgi:nucleoside-diphosphate-sugar epimerase
VENLVGALKPNPLADDLDHVLAHTKGLWEEVRGQRVFMTGGTGFFGCWLLESFLWTNDKLGLNASASVLTRDGEAFRKKAPHLAAHPAVQLCEGDVRTFEFPAGTFSHVIHAATAASATLNDDDPVSMFDTIVLGTKRTLEFARQCGAPRFLLTSSGAIYGPQPWDLTHIPEEYTGAPDPAQASGTYGEGKRAAEMLCAAYARQHGVQSTIARCFAFAGPYLPLDAHFAAGNFIGDALRGGPIRVNGDGTPYRSYLYAADLAIWLWTILIRGEAMRPYNVGSASAVTIEELAHVVARSFTPPLAVAMSCRTIAGTRAHRYVPAVSRAERELGLRQSVSLPDAIARTIRWHTSTGARPRVAHS